MTPRDTSEERAAFLRAHARARHGEADMTRTGVRQVTVYDLSDCEHTTSRLLEVENPHGAWVVEVCENCGEQTHRECAHKWNSWNAEETVLTCDNCGVDGT